MPLPGGLSDKIGNRYEDRWTVRCVFDVLDNKAEAIRLEPPSADDDGVEFWVQYADRIEYHQCKRQRTREGVWNLTALGAAGVLSAFLSKLSDPQSDCVFVSTRLMPSVNSPIGLVTQCRLMSSLRFLSRHQSGRPSSTGFVKPGVSSTPTLLSKRSTEYM